MTLELHGKAGGVLRQLVFPLLFASSGLGEKWRYALFAFGNPALVGHVKTLHGIETTPQGLVGFEGKRDLTACFCLRAELPQTFDGPLHPWAQRGIPFDGSFIVRDTDFLFPGLLPFLHMAQVFYGVF